MRPTVILTNIAPVKFSKKRSFSRWQKLRKTLALQGRTGQGKVDLEWFLPGFQQELAKHDVPCVLVTSRLGLALAMRKAKRFVLIHIYNEEHPLGPLADLKPDPSKLAGVFNPPDLGPLIASKSATHDYLTARGVLMPERATPQSGFPVFSNVDSDSHGKIELIQDSAALAPDRYNTRFIDTRRTYKGQSYHTSVRLTTIGPTILAAYIRLRPDTDDQVSAYGISTPLDPDLIAHFQTELVDKRRAELTQLAERVGAHLPFTFLAHDLIPETETGRIYLCETGLKFDDFTYRDYLAPIADALPATMRTFLDPRYPAQVAEAMLKTYPACFSDV